MRLMLILLLLCPGIGGRVYAQFQPVLLSPADDAVLYSGNPIFVWSAPGAVQYAVTLVECQLLYGSTYQTPAIALLSNPPVYQSVVTTSTLIYPISAPALLSGKRYAWQVQASYPGEPGEVLASEPLVFELAESPSSPEESDTPENAFYYALPRRSNGYMVPLDEGYLPVYFENFQNGPVAFSLKRLSGAPVSYDFETLEQQVKYGENRLRIDFSALNSGGYLLTLTGEREQVWNLEFYKGE
ncbi:MAG: hypothetical protein KF690_02110 [Bacteroidetes bacterium]|nr:hypothetical protein [Bacteroidota bacterium]